MRSGDIDNTSGPPSSALLGEFLGMMLQNRT